MPFIFIIIGTILIIAAFNGTHAVLAQNLEKDLPGFFKWFIAIAVILGIGYVPGLRTPTRWLLGLVALVIVLTQYKAIVQGFQNFASTGQQTQQQAATSEQQAAQVAQQQATQAQNAQVALGGGSSGTSAGFGSIGTAADLASLAVAMA